MLSQISAQKVSVILHIWLGLLEVMLNRISTLTIPGTHKVMMYIYHKTKNKTIPRKAETD